MPTARAPRKGPLQLAQEAAREATAKASVPIPAQIGIPTLFVVGLMTVAAVASWFVFVLADPLDWMLFTIAFELSILIGNTAVAAIAHLTPGLLAKRSPGTTAVLFFIPIVTSFVVFAATSAGVSPDDFDPDFVPLQIIAMLCFLAIAAGLLGLAVYLMVVLPVVWAFRAVVPPKTNDSSSPTMGMGRRELLGASVIFPAVILFGVSMHFVAPDPRGDTTRADMGVQFLTLVTGNGPLLPVIGVIVSIALVIAGGVIYQSAYTARTRGRD